RAAAAFARAASHSRRAAFVLPAGSGLDRPAAAQAAAEGAGMAAYRFGRYKSSPKTPRLESMAIVGGDPAAVARGAAVARAVGLARDLVNEPAGAMTPRRLAGVATDIAQRVGAELAVMDEIEIEAERRGGPR